MSIITTIKTNPDVRRLFGERELKIIEKQLIGVNLKPSEKTRLSRDIRKKFEIIKQLGQFSNEFKLKKAAHTKTIIEKVKYTIIKNKLFDRVKRIIIFGSFVENELRLGSDIDLAVEFNKINEKEAFQFRLDIIRETSDKVDIQVYNFLPDKIKKDIDKHGRTIYERPN